MLDKTLHRTIMANVIKDFYSDPLVGNNLVFKGGTAAYFFYALPRLSVDLDFDLVDESVKQEVFSRVKELLIAHGELLEATEKRFTLFFLLRYQRGTRNLKIEISKRKSPKKYSIKNFLGLPVFVVDQDSMVSGKIAAFLTRKEFATRDAFDLWFFLKNNWPIDEKEITYQLKLSLKEVLTQSLNKAQTITSKDILYGLGELVDEKQKNFIREKLVTDLVFYIRLYLENLK